MFVTREENYAKAMALWSGAPSGGLMWTTYFYREVVEKWAEQTGCAEPPDFLEQQLGSMQYAEFVHPVEIRCPQVEVVRRQEDGLTVREHRSPWGTLTETTKGGRLMRHRVSSPEELRTQISIWENTEIRPLPERFEQAMQAGRGRWPVVVSLACSPIQLMIQSVMSVEDFWYAMSDYPALMEQAFAAWQRVLLDAWRIVVRFPADGFCQDENTSTTLISPAYYERHSLGHVREYAEIVHGAGKRLVVHMCGHLRDLVRLFPRTTMDGIDCLTPPPVGNCEFGYVFGSMPRGFFCTGRFGSSMWYNRPRGQIMANLAAILSHAVYRERAFVLGVTGDGMNEIPLENILLLRDCINDYEKSAASAKQ